MSQYKTGTATFTNGSATVTGSGTAWLTNVAAGDYIVRVGDVVCYEVASVVSDTSLTLTANYGGVTGSGLSYVVHKDFHPNGAPKWANGDVEFAAIQNRWNAQLLAGTFGTSAFVNTGTDAGDVPLNSDLGAAAYLNTGTAAGELPSNGDLGAAAYLNTGTGAGELPTNGDLPTFGTAASADLTTSPADTTSGRPLVVGSAPEQQSSRFLSDLNEQQIGVGQTWQTLTGSRALSTIYTNSTGKPIAVSVVMIDSAGGAAIAVEGLVDGFRVSVFENVTAAGLNNYATVSMIVPDGSTYQVTGSANDTINNWMELR